MYALQTPSLDDTRNHGFAVRLMLPKKASFHPFLPLIPKISINFGIRIFCRTIASTILPSPKCSEIASHFLLPSPKGANVNNRWWNDRREWNLRIADTLSHRPQRGRTGAKLGVVRPLWGRFLPNYWLSAGSMTFGHSTSGY